MQGLFTARGVRTALQLAVAATLLALLWRAADGPAALRSLAAAEWRWLAAALAALTLQTVFSALRWQLTAGRLGIGIGLNQSIREYYLSQVVNQSLPGGILGDAGRAYRTRQAAGVLTSTQAVVIERLAGQIAMFVTLTIAFVVTLLLRGGLDWPRWLAMPLGVVLLAGLALPMILTAVSHLRGPAGRAATSIRRILRTTLTDRAVLPSQIALSGATTICNLAAFAFCARAVGLSLPIGAITALVPLILFTMLVPISISGWGVREGAAAALLPLAGATASAALAASIAFGIAVLVSVLPGAVLFLIASRAEPSRL